MNIFKKSTSALKMLARMNPFIISSARKHLTTNINKITIQSKPTFTKFSKYTFAESNKKLKKNYPNTKN